VAIAGSGGAGTSWLEIHTAQLTGG
jgi:hypothetical protein